MVPRPQTRPGNCLALVSLGKSPPPHLHPPIGEPLCLPPGPPQRRTSQVPQSFANMSCCYCYISSLGAKKNLVEPI